MPREIHVVHEDRESWERRKIKERKRELKIQMIIAVIVVICFGYFVIEALSTYDRMPTGSANVIVGQSQGNSSLIEFKAGYGLTSTVFRKELGTTNSVFLNCEKELVDAGFCVVGGAGSYIEIKKDFKAEMDICCEEDMCFVQIGEKISRVYDEGGEFHCKPWLTKKYYKY